MNISATWRKAALMLAIPTVAVAGLAAMGGTAFAGGKPPPPPKPPVVKVVPAIPIYGEVSCTALDAAQKGEIATLTADLNAVESQAAHSLGYAHTWFLADAAALKAQIAAIHVAPCPVVGYRCPNHDILTVVETRTGPHTWVKTDVCLVPVYKAPPKV
jgi:hypothetical protein